MNLEFYVEFSYKDGIEIKKAEITCLSKDFNEAFLSALPVFNENYPNHGEVVEVTVQIFGNLPSIN